MLPLQPLLRMKRLGGYQSGQMGQTVNLLAMPSVVRIHHHPLFPKITQQVKSPTFARELDFLFNGVIAVVSYGLIYVLYIIERQQAHIKSVFSVIRK